MKTQTQSRRHRVLTLVASLSVVFGVLATGGPAQAAVDDGVCNLTEFCAYRYGGLSTLQGEWTGNDFYWGSPINDNATSVYNRGASCNIRFWEGHNRTGHYGDLARGAIYENLFDWWIVWPTYNFDNRISGHEWRC